MDKSSDGLRNDVLRGFSWQQLRANRVLPRTYPSRQSVYVHRTYIPTFDSATCRSRIISMQQATNIVLEPRSILGLRSRKLLLGRTALRFPWIATSILQPRKELTEISTETVHVMTGFSTNGHLLCLKYLRNLFSEGQSNSIKCLKLRNSIARRIEYCPR
jgi:hypothetical protein